MPAGPACRARFVEGGFTEIDYALLVTSVVFPCFLLFTEK
jgi:hypothetical protein